MMTGTPTGEMLFFPNIKHIKVKKEDLRVKECIINLVPSSTEQIRDMCVDMAQNIIDGKYLVIINRDSTPYDNRADLVIHEKLGDIFSKLTVNK